MNRRTLLSLCTTHAYILFGPLRLDHSLVTTRRNILYGRPWAGYNWLLHAKCTYRMVLRRNTLLDLCRLNTTALIKKCEQVADMPLSASTDVITVTSSTTAILDVFKQRGSI